MSAALEESASKITEQAQAKIDALSQSYQKAYDNVTAKQSAMLSKLSDVANMYDLDSQIEKINRYQSGLDRLRGRIPKTLMEKIFDMDVSTANAFTDYLNGLTDEQLSSYVSKWDQIQNKSKSYTDNFFKGELETIKNSYSREIDLVMADTRTQITKAGEDVAKGLVTGMQSQIQNLSKTAKKLAKQLVKSFKKALKINSPSKVMDEEIGRFLPPGITKGFLKALPKAQTSISDSVSKAIHEIQSRVSGIQYYHESTPIHTARYPTPQVTVINDGPAQVQAEIHTTVELDGRTVGKVVTPYVNQNLADRAEQERRGS